MAERAGLDARRPALARRFDDGFAAPFVTALPDLTFPSRRDSQYAISLRQWRFAELCELGLARRDDPRLRRRCSRGCTTPSVARARHRARAFDGRRRAQPAGDRADARRSRVARRCCSRAPTLPPLEPHPLASVLLDGAGLRASSGAMTGALYVALDYGHSGGGHGHPDRLNLLLADGDVRWLDDLGTGSYVEPSLHWYRSTLAHNAPLVDGRSQRRVDGELLALRRARRGRVGRAPEPPEIAPGVRRAARRRRADYLRGPRSTLGARPYGDPRPPDPLRRRAAGVGEWNTAPLGGGPDPDDGFEFLHEIQRATVTGT